MKKHIVIIFILLMLIFSSTVTSIKTNFQNNEYETKKIEVFELPTPYSEKKTFFVEYLNNPAKENPPIYEATSIDDYNYVIITTEGLENAITSSSFIQWKVSIGFNIKIVKITDSEIDNQQGDDLPAKIRNFLREYLHIWGIEYVLIVADHDTIPMKYCYPNPDNHINTAGIVGGSGGDVPTDYYYADLSLHDDESWDSDNDGYFGEYGDDSPDFSAEVSVGRIPTNIPSRITYVLDKTVSFEQDVGSWKNSALHGGAFWYFTNEDNSGQAAYDGAVCMNEIEANLMNDWTIYHYSEQEGLEKSLFDWPALTQDAFSFNWREDDVSIVNWGAHGWSDGAYNKIWSYDDGDGIPEGNEATWRPFIHLSSVLDDNRPAIVFGISCVINYPEENPSGQIGVDLLTKPSYGGSIGVIASTRSPYGTLGWPDNKGGAESQCYEFNRFLINEKELVGDAFYKAMYYCTSNYGWNSWIEYNNNYCFNLYGDPTLKREGISTGMPSAPVIDGPKSGRPNNNYDYTFSSVDPTNDDVFYYIDWGDANIEEWIGPYSSGEEITLTHTWTEKDTFNIRAKTKDINEEESTWSTLEVSMPNNYLINIISDWMNLKFSLLKYFLHYLI